MNSTDLYRLSAAEQNRSTLRGVQKRATKTRTPLRPAGSSKPAPKVRR